MQEQVGQWLLLVRSPKVYLRAVGIALVAGAALGAQDTKNATAAKLVGRVTTADHKPVDGAEVELRAFAHPELPVAAAWALGAEGQVCVRARADARGWFEVALPHRGPYSLIATAGEQSSGVRFPVLAGEAVELELLPRVFVSGVVRRVNGQACAGASVSEWNYGDAATSRERYGRLVARLETTADANGRFRLPVRDSDPHGWPLAVRSLRAWDANSVSVDSFYRVDGQHLADVSLTLSLTTRACGRVVAPNGAPIAGAEVVDFDDAQRSVRTDAAGNFALEGVRGTNLLARAPGYAVITVNRQTLAETIEVLPAANEPAPANAGATGGIRIEMARTPQLRLRLTAGGAPVAQRRVVFVTRAPGEAAHVAWTTSTSVDGEVVAEHAHRGRLLHGFVDRNGKFVAFHCAPAPDENRDLGDVALQERRIEGVVLSPDGLRCAGAMVLLQPDPQGFVPDETQTPAALTRFVYTDRSGRFEFDGMLPIPYWCAINGGFDGMRVVRLTPGAPASTIKLGEGTTLAGVVRLADGSPVAHALTQYIVVADPRSEVGRFGLTYLKGKTDAEGHVRVRGLPPHRSYTVWATFVKDGRAYMSPYAGSVDERSVFELTLAPHSGRF